MNFRLFPDDKCRKCNHSRICHVIVQDGITGNQTQNCYPSLGTMLKFLAPSCDCHEYLPPLRGNENGKINSTPTDS